MDPNSAVLLLRFLLNVRYWIQSYVPGYCFGCSLLPGPGGPWGAVEVTLKVGFIYPFVCIEPTDLGETIVVAQA